MDLRAQMKSLTGFGFWIRTRFSWAGLALLVVLTAPSAAEEAPVPWLFQPLQPPSRLVLSEPHLELDYTERVKPGSVAVRFGARLKNPLPFPLKQALLFVSPDPDSVVTFGAAPVAQDRVVMPLPGGSGMVSGRVSIVSLILLGGESGELRFEGRHPLEFLSSEVHRVTLSLPSSRSWAQGEDFRINLRLGPELELESEGWQATPGGYQRAQDRHAVEPLEVKIRAARTPGAALGALGATPALWRSWVWGLAAVLLALLPGWLWRPLWWLAPPLAALLHAGLLQGDPTCRQWSYYRDARVLGAALHNFQYYAVPFIALLGAAAGFRLSADNKKLTRSKEVL